MVSANRTSLRNPGADSQNMKIYKVTGYQEVRRFRGGRFFEGVAKEDIRNQATYACKDSKTAYKEFELEFQGIPFSSIYAERV